MKKLIPFLLILSVMVSFCSKGNSSPEDAMKNLHTALLTKNGAAIFDNLSADTSAKLEQAFKAYFQIMLPMVQQSAAQNPEMKKMVEKASELVKTSGKEFFMKLFENLPGTYEGLIETIKVYELVKVEVTGDKAKGTLKLKDKEMPVNFVKENGGWKLDLADLLSQGGAPAQRESAPSQTQGQ